MEQKLRWIQDPSEEPPTEEQQEAIKQFMLKCFEEEGISIEETP